MSGKTHWICPHCEQKLELNRPNEATRQAQAQWQLFECEKCAGIALLNLSEELLSPIKVDARQKKPALPPTPPKFEIPKPVFVAAPKPAARIESEEEISEIPPTLIAYLENTDEPEQPQPKEPAVAATHSELPEPLPETPVRGHWVWKSLPFLVLAASFYALIGVAQFITRSVPTQTTKAKTTKTEKAAVQNETAVRAALNEEMIESTRSAPATHIRVTPEAIVMRAGPSSDYSHIGNLRQGMVAEILESKSDRESIWLWYKVENPVTKRTGWVRGDLVELLR